MIDFMKSFFSPDFTASPKNRTNPARFKAKMKRTYNEHRKSDTFVMRKHDFLFHGKKTLQHRKERGDHVLAVR